MNDIYLSWQSLKDFRGDLNFRRLNKYIGIHYLDKAITNCNVEHIRSCLIELRDQLQKRFIITKNIKIILENMEQSLLIEYLIQTNSLHTISIEEFMIIS